MNGHGKRSHSWTSSSTRPSSSAASVVPAAAGPLRATCACEDCRRRLRPRFRFPCASSKRPTRPACCWIANFLGSPGLSPPGGGLNPLAVSPSKALRGQPKTICPLVLVVLQNDPLRLSSSPSRHVLELTQQEGADCGVVRY